MVADPYGFPCIMGRYAMGLGVARLGAVTQEA